MYPRYNMAYNRRNMYGNYGLGSNRIFGGGFIAPFVLGGLVGSAINRPYYPYNNFYYNNYYRPYFW